MSSGCRVRHAMRAAIRWGMTVLIVDDHPAMRGLIRQVVGSLAHAVYECSHGADALAAYAAHRPDVVLMDIALPGVDGITLTRQIRRAHADARVVMVTDYDEDVLRDAAARAGASGYVLKANLLALRPLLVGWGSAG